MARLEKVVSLLGTAEGKPVVALAPQSRPPTQPENSLTLHLAARSHKGTWNEFPVENWIVLKQEETVRLLPTPGLAVGKSWQLDKDISSKFLVKFLPNGFAYADYHKTQVTEQELKGTILSIEKGIIRTSIEGKVKLKHRSLNFNVRPPAEIEQEALANLIGFLDFNPDTSRVLTLRILAQKAGANNGAVEYSVALRSIIPDQNPKSKEVQLFDFENPEDLKVWSNLELPLAKDKEPPVKIELSTDHASLGKQSLKLTFDGGQWPTITTQQIPNDLMPFLTFKADVTASRDCLIGFTIMQEKSQRGGGWDATVSRWAKTQFLKAGKNEVVGPLHDSNNYSINEKQGKAVRFEIFMYAPHKGEVIFIDNIRISPIKEDRFLVKTDFKVLGTELAVSGVQELGKTLKENWVKPEIKTIDQVETNIKAQYSNLIKKHPKAVLALFRDGSKGFDPANPDALYTGWKDAYWTSHGPDGDTIERARNTGKETGHEIFMRHRSPLMQVDLSTIPKCSNILAAQLIVVRAFDKPVKEHNPEQPNIWVVEPCNRPWNEYEVNAFEFAKDKFWKAIGGMNWAGNDPDFFPIYLAHGSSQGKVNSWDFTEAIRFWTDGSHPNHGFMLHGNAGDWMPRAHARETKEIKDRPAVWVIYEPNDGKAKEK